MSAPICRQPRINSRTETHINSHVLTNIPKPRLRIARLLRKIYHKTCATNSTKFVLLVFIAKTVHGELAFAGIERKVAAERVDVQVAINLADTAVALIDVDGGKSRECESELDRATVAGAVVGRKFVLSGVELGLIRNLVCGGFGRNRVGHDTSRKAGETQLHITSR
jgi:hypothetical protein